MKPFSSSSSRLGRLLTLAGLLSLISAPVSAAEKVQDRAKALDALVDKKLAAEKLQANPRASDEVFLRRVYLDIVGRIPTLKETTSFLSSQAPDKRAQLIDQLLNSDGYSQNFFNYWADLLRLKSTPVGGNQSLAGGTAYANYVKQCLTENKPYDAMVRELLTANGKTYENGAVGFYLRDYNMQLDNMAVTTQVFLGTQMVCAQCHNHPFDKWTQMDYYEMAAYTYGVRSTNNARTLDSGASMYGKSGKKRKKGGVDAESRKELGRAMTEILRPLRFNYVVSDDRALHLPHDYAYDDAKPKSVVEPTIPASFSQHGTTSKEGQNPVVAYADWMTAPENPRFTLVIANRLWKKVMGYGVIEPVDQLTDSTVPSNPELMAALEHLMQDVNYDMKAYLRVLLNTDTYQREAYNKDIGMGDPFYFTGPVVRRMSAEQIWDSMNTLIHPNPDIPNREAKLAGENLLTRVRWMDQALNALSNEELTVGARKIADLQKDLADQVRKAQVDLVKAQEAKDEEGIRKAKKIVSRQRATINEAVEDIVFQMGYEKFIELAKAGKLKEQADPDLARDLQTVLKAPKGNQMVFDQALNAVQRIRRDRLRAAEERLADRLRAEFNVTKETNRDFNRYLYLLEHYAMRAADVRSPAPVGHFLREFGQSDRELVENANPDATVGQALMLMNGDYLEDLLNPFTVISRALARAETPAQAVDTLYLSLMSRHATPEETKLLSPVIAANAKTGKAEALWALLNTREFLFVD
ncbi:MAG: DUF1549 domain-containing protein [Verrucomicrobiales bacterium]|nr:DUF1549 domain-containing protein [Verrucomicrobiales bacterium]